MILFAASSATVCSLPSRWQIYDWPVLSVATVSGTLSLCMCVRPFLHHGNLVSHNNNVTGWDNTSIHTLDGTSIPPPVPSWLFVTAGQSRVLCRRRLRLRNGLVLEPGAAANHDFVLLWSASSLKVTAIKRMSFFGCLLPFYFYSDLDREVT